VLCDNRAPSCFKVLRTRSGQLTSGFGCCVRAGGSSSTVGLDASASPEPLDNARKSPEYAAIGDRLRFLGGTFEGEPQLLRCKKAVLSERPGSRFLTGPKNRLSRARVTRPAISRFLAR
jgi:hypothetical protein